MHCRNSRESKCLSRLTEHPPVVFVAFLYVDNVRGEFIIMQRTYIVLQEKWMVCTIKLLVAIQLQKLHDVTKVLFRLNLVQLLFVYINWEKSLQLDIYSEQSWKNKNPHPFGLLTYPLCRLTRIAPNKNNLISTSSIIHKSGSPKTTQPARAVTFCLSCPFSRAPAVQGRSLLAAPSSDPSAGIRPTFGVVVDSLSP